jgi:CubicO group peptidase (beta-lactamase class C family)
MKSTVLVSSVVTALLVGAPAYAQDKTSEIDDIFSWVTPGMPGCVVGVSQNGEVVVNRAYGLANLDTGAPIGPRTVFDIGSVQKQFSAAAALLLVEEGRLSLSADIREYLPELPDYGQRVTLDHLMTHTSGIRDWLALMNFNRGDEDALTLILRQRGLNFAPGEQWAYSNSNFELVKEIVARASGMPFAEFARRRLFEPLGMEHTMYAADIRAAEHGAVAYEKEGDRWEPDMMLGQDRGGGAVLSTAGDLLIWNDALTSARLGKFVSEKLQEPATLSNGRKLSYARGLMLDANYAGRVVWHGGSAAGYKSVLARYPEQGLSIAILCNAGEAADDRDDFAARIFDLFASPTGTRPAEPAPVAVPPVEGLDVNSKAGVFFSERTGEPLRLVANNGRLGIAGGGSLVAVSKDRFRNPRPSLSFMSEDEFELTFLSEDQFELKSMEGRTTRYRRAVPYTPTATDLEGFAGRYESDELRAEFQIAAGTGGLIVRLNDSPDQVLEFAPVARDIFQRGMITMRFRRDQAGTVVALDFSLPVLRNVRFTRLSDRSQ